MKKIIIFIGMLLIAATLFSQDRQRESYYQDRFAEIKNGVTEVVLKDRTRVDIVTEEYTIEVDFAEKWAESGFQSLHYANALNKKAGILLVWEGSEDERYLKRLLDVIAEHDLPITVWVWDWTNDTWGLVDYFYDCELKFLY